MLISRTPMRVSFVGGGTDIENYYSKFGGEVVSCAINKYIYVTLNKRDDNKIVICYSAIEYCTHVNEIKHTIVREALKMYGFETGGIEIHIIANISTIGTGLGGSSAVAVGLLRVLFPNKTQHEIAELACELEIKKLKKCIGKQDQYACAIGGINRLFFENSGSVKVKPLYYNDFFIDNMFLIPVNNKREKTEDILKKQNDNFNDNIEKLHDVKTLCELFINSIKNNDANMVINCLNNYWDIKKTLSNDISNDCINELISKYRNDNCGVKLCGAGQSGFIFIFDKTCKTNGIPIKIDYSGTVLLKNINI